MRFAFYEDEIAVVGPQSRQEREVMLQLAGSMWKRHILAVLGQGYLMSGVEYV